MSFLSKLGVVEDDTPAPTKKPAPAHAAPAPAYTPAPPTTFQPQGGYTPPPVGGYQPQPVMTPELQKKMEALESIVYASAQSTYVVFRNFRSQPAMINQDPAMVLNLLASANGR